MTAAATSDAAEDLPIRAILFDVGNTLINLDFDLLASLAYGTTSADRLRSASPGVWKALDSHLEECRRSGTRPRTLHYILSTYAEATEMLPSAGEAWMAKVVTENRRRTLWRCPQEEASGVLQMLRGHGIPIGVVSNADGHIGDLLSQCGWDGHFDAIIDSGVVGVEKPDPYLFHLGRTALGTAPAETAYIGDLPAIDIRGAVAAGLRPVLFDPDDMFAERSADLAAELRVPIVRISRLNALCALAGLS